MRMLKDYRKYRILYRAVLRMQGFCKSWEIRRAYMEVRSAAKVFQKHARSYLAHQKLLDMKESEDPALTKEKKKEEILKILYPERFGRGKMNLSGKRRPMRLQPVKVAGDDEGDVEYLEMPKFAIVHEGWLNVKIGMMGKWQKTYVALKQGTLTLFEDHESLTAIISYNMANCLVKAEDAQIVITRTEKLYKHKVRSFRDMGRRIKGPLWGQDVILFQITPDIKEAGKVWADKLEESLCEAKLVDSYKMQVNLDGDDDEKPVNQKVASIIKEGYLRKKKPGNSAVQVTGRHRHHRHRHHHHCHHHLHPPPPSAGHEADVGAAVLRAVQRRQAQVLRLASQGRGEGLPRHALLRDPGARDPASRDPTFPPHLTPHL